MIRVDKEYKAIYFNGWFLYLRPWRVFKNEYFKFTRNVYHNCNHYGILCFGLSISKERGE